MNPIIDRTGNNILTKEGYSIKITRYVNAHDCDIEFEDGVKLYKVPYGGLKTIKKPQRRVGERHENNEGCELEILEYYSHKNCTIRFFKTKTILYNQFYSRIVKGSIKDPYHKTICNVGFYGIGKYKCWNHVAKTQYKPYSLWRNMLVRCYNYNSQTDPTYKEVTVCDEWHNYQTFAEWFEENYVDSFHLDKDILCPECKIYSPETCAFVPQQINSLFTKRQNCRGALPIGVSKKGTKFKTGFTKNNMSSFIGVYDTPEEAFQEYKKAKEAHIKEIAEKWKDKIDPRVYEVMLKYEVKITD